MRVTKNENGDQECGYSVCEEAGGLAMEVAMACVKERRERVIDRNAVCGLREAVRGKPSKRDLRRVALPLVVAAVWLATVLALPGRASAISRDFELSTASSLMLGSGAVLGGDYAVYA